MCGMAPEPRQVAGEEINPELVDMTRLFWISLSFTVPTLLLMVSSLCARHSHFPAAAASTSPAPRATCWLSGPSDVERARVREFAESQPGGPPKQAHGAFAVLPVRAMAR